MIADALCRVHLRIAVMALAQALAWTPLAAQVPTPEAHFGFRMGADRQLAAAATIEAYFALVAARTDRVQVIDIGPTTEGQRTIAAIVTAPENIRTLKEIRADNQRLADPRTISADDARRVAGSHKAIVAIGAGIHADEVGGTQAASDLLYELATSTAHDTIEILQNVVLILIPSLNPDGYRRVVDWYEKTKGTSFEGAPTPWLPHKYVGHDINRDAFMLNLAESRNLARFFHAEWHPQVFLSMHQMGRFGARMFVPPVADPIDRNYDPLIWREAALLGGAMALELQRDRRSGVISNALYDYYWPGYEDSAPLGRNTVCLLTEVASANVATPITLSSSDLAGLPDSPTVNFPDPWPSGRWSLRDIVEYDLSAARGLLRAAAAYRQPIVENFYEMGARAIETGQRGEPFAFVATPDQYDRHAAAKLEELLLQAGVEIHRAAAPFRAGDQSYPAGTDIILLAQPYRSYIKTLLERQSYPIRRPPAGGDQTRPYDVAGWTLPAQMGVDVRVIDRPFELPLTSRLTSAAIAPVRVDGDKKPSHYIIDARGNAGALAINRLLAAGVNVAWTAGDSKVDLFTYPAGSLVVGHSKTAETVVTTIASQLGLRATGTRKKPAVAVTPVGGARIGLYQPWTGNADEGWTRWLFDQYQFRYKTVLNDEMRAGGLRARYDVIILPSAASDQLADGNPPDRAPAEYAGGLADEGIEALRVFVEAGGTLICLDQACALPLSRYKLPLRDAAHDEDNRELFCPGSILKLDLDSSQIGVRGMAAQSAAFFAFSSAYDVTDESRVQVLARYGRTDLLISGWLEGGPVLAGKAAAVEVTVGAGRIVLLGFPVQHRGQTLATFRLLFNALFTSPQAPPPQPRRRS